MGIDRSGFLQRTHREAPPRKGWAINVSESVIQLTLIHFKRSRVPGRQGAAPFRADLEGGVGRGVGGEPFSGNP